MRPAIVAWLETRIGVGFFVPDYDVLLAGAVVLAFFLAMREAKRRGLDEDKVFRAGVAMAAVGFVMARLYVVVTHPAWYIAQPLDALLVWKGGTASTGMYLGVTAAGVLAARRYGMSAARLLDACAPSAAAGIVLGRVACFLNGCCYGSVSDLPWAVRFPPDSGPQVSQASVGLVGIGDPSAPVHPVQLYEAAFAAVLFVVLMRYRRAIRPDGTLAALFFLLYGSARFVAEFVRGDPRPDVWGLSVPQLFCLVAIIGASGYLLRAKYRRAVA